MPVISNTDIILLHNNDEVKLLNLEHDKSLSTAIRSLCVINIQPVGSSSSMPWLFLFSLQPIQGQSKRLYVYVPYALIAL